GRMIFRPITEVVGHGRRIDHLAGIEEVMRIEGILDLAEGFIDRVAEHFPIPFTAGQTIAMLAAQGAAKLQQQVGDVRSDLSHAVNIKPILEIEKRSDMNATDAGMAIKSAIGAMSFQQIAKTSNEF